MCSASSRQGWSKPVKSVMNGACRSATQYRNGHSHGDGHFPPIAATAAPGRRWATKPVGGNGDHRLDARGGGELDGNTRSEGVAGDVVGADAEVVEGVFDGGGQVRRVRGNAVGQGC